MLDEVKGGFVFIIFNIIHRLFSTVYEGFFEKRKNL
jgi:hypothetical protein